MIGVSQAVSDNLSKIFPRARITTIVNAICFERLLREEKSSNNKSVVLLMMGWDYVGKGVDLALKATRRLRETHQNVELHIVAAIHEKSLKNYCHKILGEKASWVKVLPPTDNIAKYYCAADVFLSPSRSEAFCYAAVEATYCGNSLVASKVNGQGELKIDGAYWFESENIDDFHKQLYNAVNDLNDVQMQAVKKRAQEEVQQLYSLERWSNEFVALF